MGQRRGDERGKGEGGVLESSERVRSGTERTITKGALEKTVAATPKFRNAEPGRRELESAQTTQRSTGFSEADMLQATQLLGSEVEPAASAGAADDERATLEPFGPYSRIEVLDEQGSIGLVARGFNEAFGRWELLKFLREEYEEDVEAVRQFKREGRVLAQLSHPNVVQVFATYEVEGRTCLAMEYLHGQSLTAHVAQSGGRLGIERAEQLFLEAARGLAAAHEAGLLHRDIKPDNLFVTAGGRGRLGGLKLIDFGLATADRSRRLSTAGDPSLVSGTLGGTPLFMAPELWTDHAATPGSDLYALGITFYFALTGQYPFSATTLGAIRQEVLEGKRLPGVRQARPDVPGELAAIVDRAMALDPAERFDGADELVGAIVSSTTERERRAIPKSGPYRGLEPFTADERDVFFGRTREVAELTEKLRVQPAVVLVGPSGSGKSSLALAGVAPAVADGALGGGIVFQPVRVEPRLRPCRSLASALATALGADAEAVASSLEHEPKHLAQSLLGALGPSQGLLLIVDQLEELATIALDAGDVLRFATAIESLVDSPTGQLKIVATLRADLMDRLFAVEPLRSLLTRAFYPVRPLLGEPLRRAIVEPARIAGYELEDPAVAAEIVEGVARTPAGLPLASFAMQAWWRERDEARKLLATATWRELGGLAGALTRHADEVLDAMPPEERAAADQILVRLVTDEGARSVAPRAELVDPSLTGTAGARALDRLVDAKLVVESAGEVELVHEALATSWPRLRRLIESSGEDRAYRQRVVGGAREWDAHGRRTGTLWDGEEAARLLQWFAHTDAPLGQLELAFVDAVRAHEARRRFYRRGLVLGGVLVAVMLALITLARERRLAARLDRATTTAAKAHESHVRETRSLLQRLARLEAPRDPGAALTALLRARQLGPDDSLDPVAWRARASGVPRVLPRHQKGIALVAISPAGKRVVSVGEGGTLHWAAVRGTAAGEVLLKGGRPTALAVSPQGKQVAVASATGQVSLVHLAKGTVESQAACTSRVAALAWTSERRVVALCEASGEQVRVVLVGADSIEPIFEGAASAFALAPDGRRVVMANGDGLRIISLLSETEPSQVALSHAATALAIGATSVILADARGRIGILDFDEAKPGPRWLDIEQLHGVERIEAEPAGSGRFVVMVEGGRGFLFDTERHLVGTIDMPGGVLGWHTAKPAWPAAGPVATVAVSTGDEVTIMDADTAARLASVPVRGTNGLALSDRWLVAGSADGGMRAYDLQEISGRVHGKLGPGHCVLASDAVHVSCVDEASVRLRTGPLDGTLHSHTIERKFLPEAPVALAAGPGGRTAAWLLPDGRLVRVELGSDGIESLGVARKLEAPAGNESWLGFAPSEPVLAVTSVGTKPALLVVDRGDDAKASITHFAAIATAVAFSQDGKWLATGHVDGEVQIHGRQLRARSLGDEPVTALDVSDDGKTIAASDDAGQVVALPTRGDPRRIRRGGPKVRCLAWSRNGRALVTGDEAGKVVLFAVDTTESIPLMSLGQPIRDCRREPGADRFFFVTDAGLLYERQLDLSPVWMQRPPIDPLDPATSVSSWGGLLTEDDP